MTLDDLADRARAFVRDGRRVVLGIAGSPGAGKTTLARELVAALASTPPPGLTAGEWVVHVPMDGYHLADVELERLGRRDRKGAPDTFDAAGYAALVARLRADTGEVVYAPAFDRTIEQPVAGSIPVSPAARLVVTEGNYLLVADGEWARVRPQLDAVWFCDLDPTERVRRLVRRHTEFGKAPDAAAAWVHSVDEVNARIIESTRGAADLVIDAATLAGIGGPVDAVPVGVRPGDPGPGGVRPGNPGPAGVPLG